VLHCKPRGLVRTAAGPAQHHARQATLLRLLCMFTSFCRVQFFQLADIFLSSSMVPAYTAAAFAKKFGRLALRAPPAGAMLALGFIHNIIRRHPACMVLLHKPSTAAANGDAASGRATAAAGRDVYDEAQPDPAQSRAVESSLWELAALRNHYCPQVGVRGMEGLRIAPACSVQEWFCFFGWEIRLCVCVSMLCISYDLAPPLAAAHSLSSEPHLQVLSSVHLPDEVVIETHVFFITKSVRSMITVLCYTTGFSTLTVHVPPHVLCGCRWLPCAACWTRTWLTACAAASWTWPRCCPPATPR
jgi:hypothetical protein